MPVSLFIYLFLDDDPSSQFTFKLKTCLFIYLEWVCACVCVCACARACILTHHAVVAIQLLGISSPFPFGVWGVDSGRQTWLHVPLSPEPSCRFLFILRQSLLKCPGWPWILSVFQTNLDLVIPSHRLYLVLGITGLQAGLAGYRGLIERGYTHISE